MPMFLTVLDLANLLGISRASAYELVRRDDSGKESGNRQAEKGAKKGLTKSQPLNLQ